MSFQPELKYNNEQKADDMHVSQHGSKPHVARIFGLVLFLTGFVIAFFVGIYSLILAMNYYQMPNCFQWFILLLFGISFGLFLALKIINFID